ncbi:membrane fusion protein, multidrug efflux system [Humidesulfovibrio mexicanus]|uniref:Membrane fusion protein, multidrug efflux system n=1 Tax=Humidesulfovibrio mexicanus TaxID=147047 RepID=A0A238Y2Q6_9BACT|nr:efflux RND transporter periplasmic adaptor subunit [Humidesulfovibrio mexicanus]SNR64854.1 membrane fusion protein, multidrug efflux system [Humidesulfovibrio mexicanus]
MNARPRLTMPLFAMLALAALVCACGRANGKAPKARKAVPVLVAEAKVMSVPVLVQAVGNVEAFASVSIKPQVSGVIAKQLVRDGQDVVKDQTLFVIDPRTYHAGLLEAQARLQKDEAQARKAEDDLKRYQTLFEQGAVSRDQLEQMRTNAMTLRASLDLDRAQVEQARVQLGHATIKAPISGRAGHVLVQEGNVVGKSGDDRVLLVINQLTPISVTFSVPESHLPEIQRQWAQGPLRVEARSSEGVLLETGELASIDNAVDKATGTIRLKATFPNAQKQLWPGQFVRASLRLSERENAVLIPAHAVQNGLHGPFVFVVKDDLVVELREVSTSPGGDGTLVAEKGVAPGERVVTDGQVMLVPGSLVEIRPQPDEGSGRRPVNAPTLQGGSSAAQPGQENATLPQSDATATQGQKQ